MAEAVVNEREGSWAERVRRIAAMCTSSGRLRVSSTHVNAYQVGGQLAGASYCNNANSNFHGLGRGSISPISVWPAEINK